MKLTKDYRQQIIDRCVTARFAEAKKQYEAARTALADALYDHSFGKAEELAKKLPPEWCSTMQTVYITSEGFGSRYYKDDSKPSSSLKLSRSRLMPAIITTQFEVKEGHQLYLNAQQVRQMFEAIETGKATLTRQLKSLLYSVNTREKLLEVWPEGEPFFPAVMQQAPVPIPYDLTMTINQLMGIGAEMAGAQ